MKTMKNQLDLIYLQIFNNNHSYNNNNKNNYRKNIQFQENALDKEGKVVYFQ